MELDMGSITNRRNTTSACPSWNHAKDYQRSYKNGSYLQAQAQAQAKQHKQVLCCPMQRWHQQAQAQAKPTAQLNEVR
ncbi:unnamed protein product [Fusarium graminearum]|nr:unnamed protein product [Fusarium graminearum]VTO89589.1 unnamed protein product [Fusarium graminearum]